jgi:hypothetical protein
LVTGKYFYHMHERQFHPAATDVDIQERFLKQCEEISGIAFPSL